jgi:hypothetical protein
VELIGAQNGLVLLDAIFVTIVDGESSTTTTTTKKPGDDGSSTTTTTTTKKPGDDGSGASTGLENAQFLLLLCTILAQFSVL